MHFFSYKPKKLQFTISDNSMVVGLGSGKTEMCQYLTNPKVNKTGQQLAQSLQQATA